MSKQPGNIHLAGPLGEVMHGIEPVLKMSSDTLFTVRNDFYIGAYQAAIAEAADLDTLSAWEKLQRDVFVYRSYIELGSYDVSIIARKFYLFPITQQCLQKVSAAL